MNYSDKPDYYYSDSRKEMLEFLPPNAKKILEIGCADGTFGNSIKINDREIWGIEFMEQHAKRAKKKLDHVLIGKCEEHINELPSDYFDVIYCNDVLEHLIDPFDVVKKLKRILVSDGIIISSIPNVRYHNTFIKLLFLKDWKYELNGVMDKTHLRFFTKSTIKRMYEDAGYTIEKMKGINRSKSLKVWLYNLPFLFTALDIAYPQFATVARVNKQ